MNKPDVLTNEEFWNRVKKMRNWSSLGYDLVNLELQRDDTFKKTVRAVLAWLKEDCTNQSHKIHRFDLHSNPNHIDCLECWAELLKEMEE